MAANKEPIFAKSGDLSNDAGTGMNQAITAAANDYNGTGGNNSLIHTAGVDGSYVAKIRAKAAVEAAG